MNQYKKDFIKKMVTFFKAGEIEMCDNKADQKEYKVLLMRAVKQYCKAK